MSEANAGVVTPKVDGISSTSNSKPKASLDEVALLSNMQILTKLHDKSHTEFTELKKRQLEVASLHKLVKSINKATNSSGELDCQSNSEIKKMLDEAAKLGVEIPEGQYKFSTAEKERLIENINMTIEDLNVQNDMQLQTITNLNNERYEALGLAKSLLKSDHESKSAPIRNLRPH